MKCKLERLKGIDIPKSIIFTEKDNKLILTMNSSCINANMQKDRAAFEAWALLGKAKGYNEVILKLNIDDTIKCDGHYNRFLYRVYCFNELFDWFVMSKELEERAKEFYNKYFKNNDLIYNIPVNNEEKEPKHSEAKLEIFLANHTQKANEKLGLNVNCFYHQLPVGTFYEKKSRNTRLFTGSKSAIDLWGIEGNTLNVIELKVKDNKSLGVLSELFFYVCLMRDFHIEPKKAKPAQEKSADLRGFDILRKQKIKMINGIILTEQVHPQLEYAFEEIKKCNQKDKRINSDKFIEIDEELKKEYY